MQITTTPLNMVNFKAFLLCSMMLVALTAAANPGNFVPTRKHAIYMGESQGQHVYVEFDDYTSNAPAGPSCDTNDAVEFTAATNSVRSVATTGCSLQGLRRPCLGTNWCGYDTEGRNWCNGMHGVQYCSATAESIYAQYTAPLGNTVCPSLCGVACFENACNKTQASGNCLTCGPNAKYRSVSCH